jgi:hypothetical protein
MDLPQGGWLLDAMTEGLLVHPFDGQGMYAPTYGQPYEMKVYLEEIDQRVQRKNGEEVRARLFCIVSGDSSIEEYDQVDYDGRRYEVIRTWKLRFEGAVDHVEFWCRSAAPSG